MFKELFCLCEARRPVIPICKVVLRITHYIALVNGSNKLCRRHYGQYSVRNPAPINVAREEGIFGPFLKTLCLFRNFR